MSTTDEVYRIALEQLGTRGVADVNHHPDDCGELTLVAVEFADGGVMIVGPEDDGYTFSVYSAADAGGQPLAERYVTTDGNDTLESLPGDIRRYSR